ncbi:NADH-quinone oxidoreductase [Mycena leptocephala]|nr:NADH-quinone oxidoreductase [Mycena leptocephala]
MGCHRQPCHPDPREFPPIFEAPVGQSRKAVNGRLRLTVYGQTRTVPVPYKMVSQRLTKQKPNFDADAKPKAAAAKSTPSTTAKGSPAATLVSTAGAGKGPKIAIVIYSMYGHITKMAESVKAGIEEAGGNAEVLAKMYAPAKPTYPIITPDELAKYDAFLMGVPTRLGNFPAQWKVCLLPSGTPPPPSGPPAPSPANTPVLSTAGPGGGQEVTILNMISTLTHHGVLYVPLGYAHAFKQLTGLEVHGDKLPWGAAADGSRQPTALELDLVRIQGKAFCGVVSRVKF